MARDKEEKTRIKEEKKARKLFKKEAKGHEPYLNSFTRVTSRLIFAIAEYILVFIIVAVVVDYMHNGTVTVDSFTQTVADYMKPGGVILTALLAYLPILLIKNLGFYFGLGTVPRMLFGIAGYLLLIWWLYMFTTTAGDFDIIKMSGMSGSSALKGLESMTVNLTGLAKLLDIIFIICCIIPIGEFIGARKKHREAVEWKQSLKNQE